MDLHIWIMHHRDYWIMDLHNWITQRSIIDHGHPQLWDFPLVFSHIIYFHTFEDAHYLQQTFGNQIIPDTHLILLPEIIVTQSRTEVYTEWLVRHGILRRNKVFIDIFRNVPFTWRFIDNYDYMYLECVAKKYDDMLWDWMKSRFISPRPARLGLLYLFIVGGQCHTRPLMHVPGVLGFLSSCAQDLPSGAVHSMHTLTHGQAMVCLLKVVFRMITHVSGWQLT